MDKSKFTFIDLFSGIGGFHYALSEIGGACVMASDICPHANTTYKLNYGITPLGDIRDIDSKKIPPFDVLCAGFPCQSFSNVGQKKGLRDHRGALIYEVFRILKDKHPRAFILENVKGLLTHNKGKTFSYILEQLTACGYNVKYKIMQATDYGLPQIRKRLFMVGIRKDLSVDFTFPPPLKLTKTLSDIMKGKTERKYAFTIRIGGRHSGINNRFNWDCYMVNGKPRYITVSECLELQGFPKDFQLSGSESHKFKQIGNSIPTTIVKEIGKTLLKTGIFN